MTYSKCPILLIHTKPYVERLVELIQAEELTLPHLSYAAGRQKLSTRFLRTPVTCNKSF